MFNQLSKTVSEIRKEQGRISLYAFAKHYFKDHLKLIPSRAHLEIYELLEGISKSRGRHLAIAAPRGLGKSTLVTMIYVVHCIVYRNERFIVLISDTTTQAIQILDNVKRELMGNEELLADFQELSAPLPRPWTQTQIHTQTGVRVLARGTEQNLRGSRVGKFRPTLVIADDIETATNTFVAESREKLKSWFNSDILKLGGKETNYLFLGTLQHPDCMLAEYVDTDKNPHWIKRVYRALISESKHPELIAKWALIFNGKECHEGITGPDAARKFYETNQVLIDEGVELLWLEKWSHHDLLVMRETDPISFSAELQNSPLNPKDCIFDISTFHYWDDRFKTSEELLASLEGHVEFYGGCDPSTGLDVTRGDFSAIMVLARDTKDGTLYLIVADLDRRGIDKINNDILAYHQRYRFRRFAIETNQFQEVAAQLLERKSKEMGAYISLERIKNTTDKVRRIQTLQPFLKSGTIQVSKSFKLLLEQCRYFPKGKYDDALDALEMAFKAAQTRRTVKVFFIEPKDNSWISDYRRNLGWNI